MRRVVREQVACPFDRSRDLPMRAAAVRLGVADHALALNLHHIVSDASSMSVFFRRGRELRLAARPRLVLSRSRNLLIGKPEMI